VVVVTGDDLRRTHATLESQFDFGEYETEAYVAVLDTDN